MESTKIEQLIGESNKVYNERMEFIEKCIKNSKEIGEKGRQFAEKNDWKEVSKKIAIIYNELL